MKIRLKKLFGFISQLGGLFAKAAGMLGLNVSGLGREEDSRWTSMTPRVQRK